MADAMKGVTKALKSMNSGVKLPQIQKIMMDFERESEMMDMKQETMNDAIDDVMEDGDDEEEGEAIVNQVLDEIGISMNQKVVRVTKMAEAPTSKLKQQEVQQDDLQARLESLRKE
jgi:charged multivesicular body protein 2A